MKQTFKFFDTMEQATAFIRTRGRRKHSMTPWQSSDGNEHKYIVWFYV